MKGVELMLEKQIGTLEKLLNEKVSFNRMKEYENYKNIKGSTIEELNEFEKKYRIKLPEDFKEFYKYKNVSGYHFHILYPNCEGERIEPFYLFSISEMIEEKDNYFNSNELMSEYYYDDEISELDKQIKPYLRNKNWIPFATLAGGSLYLLLDYDPAEKGTTGQIISYIHDPDFVYYITQDFTELLEKSNDNLRKWKEIDY
jgi:cell wall assembly regulator SMI1